MIRDITIGQYYPAESIIHRLDPRVKLVATLVFLVSLFLFDSFWGYIPALVFLFGIIYISKVPFPYIVRGLKAVVVLLLFTLVFNIFLTKGENELVSWKFIHIYEEGLLLAGFMAVRLTMLIIGSSMMTFTTTPNQLTDGMERLFSPLKLIKVPVHEVAMMMSIALRFIPILLEETDKIIKVHADGMKWLHTGDLGYITPDGIIYFTQRLKRMIVSSGFNVYPNQIEQIIEQHPAVSKCCVVGIPHPYKMQVAKAFVVLKTDVKDEGKIKKELKELCKANLAVYSVPKEFEFRDSLPKTLMNKIDFKKLEKEEQEKFDVSKDKE